MTDESIILKQMDLSAASTQKQKSLTERATGNSSSLDIDAYKKVVTEKAVIKDNTYKANTQSFLDFHATSTLPVEQRKDFYFGVHKQNLENTRERVAARAFSSDELLHSTPKSIANSLLSAADATAQTVGGIGGAIGGAIASKIRQGNLPASGEENLYSEDNYKIYSGVKEKLGIRKESEEALANTTDPLQRAHLESVIRGSQEFTPEEQAFMAPREDGRDSAFTALATEEGLKAGQEELRSGSSDLTAAVNPVFKEAFSENIAAEFDNDKNLGSQLFGAAVEGISNPKQVVQAIADSASSFLMAGAGTIGLASLAASSFDSTYAEALEEVSNSDGFAPEQKRDLASLLSMGAAAIDIFGDAVIGGELGTILTKSKAVTTLVKKLGLAKEAGQTALVKSLTNDLKVLTKEPVKFLGKTGHSGLGEFIAEGGSAALGDLAGSQDISQIDVNEALTQGVIGGLAGVGTIAPAAALGSGKEILESGINLAAAGVEKGTDTVKSVQERKHGISDTQLDDTDAPATDSTGNVVDPENATRSDKLRTAFININRSDGTGVKKAKDLIAVGKKLVEIFNSADETLEEKQKASDVLEEISSSLDERIDFYKEADAIEATAISNGTMTPELQASLDEHREGRKQIEAVADKIGFGAVRAQTNNPDYTASLTPKDRVFSQITSDKPISKKDLLEAKRTEGLTENQTKVLDSIITSEDAKTKFLKTQDVVSHEVLNGTAKYVGLNTYMNRIHQALLSENSKKANKQLELMGKFVQQRADKAAAVNAAHKAFVESGSKETQIVEGFTGTNKDGSPRELVINEDSTGLIEQIRQEANIAEKLFNHAKGSVSGKQEPTKAPEATELVTKKEPKTTKKAPESQVKTESKPKVEVVKKAPSTKKKIVPEIKAEPKAEPAPKKVVPEVTTKPEPVVEPTVEVSKTGSVLEGLTDIDADIKPAKAANTIKRNERNIEKAKADIAKAKSELTNKANFNKKGLLSPRKAGQINAEIAKHEARLEDLNRKQKALGINPDGSSSRQVEFRNKNIVSEFTENKKNTSTLENIELVNSFNKDTTPEAMKSSLESALDRTVTDGEVAMVAEYVKQAPTIKRAVVKLLDKKAKALKEGNEQDRASRYLDPITYFINNNSEVPQQLIDSITLATFNWVAAEGANTMLNSRDDLTNLLGVSDKSQLTDAAYALMTVGVRRNQVINKLSNSVIDNLNIKVLDGMPQNIYSGLRNSLGEAAMMTLQSLGWVDVTVVPASFLNAAKGSQAGEFNTTGFEASHFVSVKRKGSEIAEQFNVTNDVIADLTNNKDKTVVAELGTRTAKTNPRMSNGQKVPAKAYEAVETYSKVPRKLDKGMTSLIMDIGKDRINSIRGYADPTKVQAMLKAGQEGKNLTLDSEYDDMIAFIEKMDATEGGRDTDVFIEMFVGSSKRVFESTKDIYPQRSKLHRFVLLQGRQIETINPSETAVLKEAEYIIAQSLGANFDNNTEASILTDTYLEDLVNNSEFSPGIQAAIRYLDGSHTEADLDLIVDASKAGGEEIHSMSGIFNAAKMYVGIQNNQDFEFTGLGEIDGKTNGPNNNFLQSGLVKLDGFFQQRFNRGSQFLNGIKNFAEWKERDSNANDTYEAVLEVVNRTIEANRVDDDATFVNQYIKEVGRNVTKGPVTVSVYGSQEAGTRGKIIQGYRDWLIGKMDKIVQASTQPTAEDKAFLDKMSRLYGLPKFTTKNEIRNFTFNEAQVKNFTADAKTNLADVIIFALDQTSGTQLAAASRIIGLSAITDAMAKIVFNTKVSELRTQLIAEGKLGTTEDLSIAQYNKLLADNIWLKQILPTKETVENDSLSARQKLEEGIATAKRTNEIATVGYAGGKLRTLEKNPEGKVTPADFDRALEEIGVPFVVNNNIQNTSFVEVPGIGVSEISNVASHTLGTGDAEVLTRMSGNEHMGLQIFDAILQSPRQLTTGAKAINEIQFDAMFDYDLQEQQYIMYKRIIDQFMTFMASSPKSSDGSLQNNRSELALTELLGVMKNLDTNIFTEIVNMNINTDGSTEHTVGLLKTKLDIILEHFKALSDSNKEIRAAINDGTIPVVISQFNKEGGEFIHGDPEGLTQEKLEETIKAIENTTKTYKTVKEVTDSAYALDDLNQVYINDSVAPGYQLTKALLETSDAKTIVKSLFSEASLIPNKSLSNHYRTILDMIQNHKMLDGLQINLITEPVKVHEVFGAGNETTRATYNADTNTINVKGTHQSLRGDNLISLTHELIHAVTVQAIDAELAKPADKQNPSIRNLEKMLKIIDTNPKYSSLKTTLAAYPDDVKLYELVAFGLSDPKVIKALQEDTETPKGIIAKLEKLIMKARNFIFGTNKTNPNAETAYDIVLNDFYQMITLSNNNVRTLRQTTSNERIFSEIETKTVQEKYDALKEMNMVQPSKSHGAYLDNILTSLEPILMMNDQSTPNEDFINEYDKRYGNKNIEGEQVVLGMGSSLQEKFLFGQLRAMYNGARDHARQEYNEIADMYDVAKKTLNYKDFLAYMPDADLENPDVDVDAEQIAHAQYDAIFNSSAVTGSFKRVNAFSFLESTIETSDYLANFAALAMVNERFKMMLNDKVKGKGKTEPVGRIESAWNKIIAKIQELIQRVRYGIKPDSGLTTKLKALTVSMNNARDKALANIDRESYFSKVSAAASDKVSTISKRILERAIYSPLYDNLAPGEHKNIPFTEKAKLVARTLYTNTDPNKVSHLFDTLGNRVENVVTTISPFAGTLVRDVRGVTPTNQKLVGLGKQKNIINDQAREEIRHNVFNGLTGLFPKSFIESMSHENHKTIYNSLIRGELHYLYDFIGSANVSEFIATVGSKKAIKHKIAEVDAEIAGIVGHGRTYNYYVNQTNGLAKLSKSGVTIRDMQNTNPYMIAKMAGTDSMIDGSPNSDLVELLAARTSLQVLNISNETELDYLNTFLTSTTLNNVQKLMNFQQGSAAEALHKNFKGRLEQTMFGYSSEQFNENIDMITIDPKDEAHYLDRGYVRVKTVKRSKKDPSPLRETLQMINTDAISVPYVAGIFPIQHQTSKGTGADLTKANDKDVQEAKTSWVRQDLTKEIIKNSKNDIDAQFDSILPENYNPESNLMVPIFNESGAVFGFRYMMSNATKYEVLEMNPNIFDAFARTKSNITVKKNTQEISLKMIDAMAEQYLKAVADRNTSGYIEMSVESTDKASEVFMSRLNPEQKARVISAFKTSKTDKSGNQIPVMYVPISMYDAFVGFKEFSVTSLFEQDPEMYGKIGRAILKELQRHIGAKGIARLRKLELSIQNLAKFAKETVVVRSVEVLIDNMISNTFQLVYLRGLSITKAIKLQFEGFAEAQKYKELKVELGAVEFEYEATTNFNRKQVLKSKLVELNDKINRNPIKHLIEAGMMQAIIDDVEVLNKDTEYGFVRADESTLIGKATGKINSALDWLSTTTTEDTEGVRLLKNVLNNALMTKQSKPYQILMQFTELSDFSSRYALYAHEMGSRINKNTNPTDRTKIEQDILRDIDNAFINYDINSSKHLDYVSKIGFAWFVKYTMRIQRELIKAAVNNPKGLFALHGAEFLLGLDVPDPTDAFFMGLNPSSKVGFLGQMFQGIETHPLFKVL